MIESHPELIARSSWWNGKLILAVTLYVMWLLQRVNQRNRATLASLFIVLSKLKAIVRGFSYRKWWAATIQVLLFKMSHLTMTFIFFKISFTYGLIDKTYIYPS